MSKDIFDDSRGGPFGSPLFVSSAHENGWREMRPMLKKQRTYRKTLLFGVLTVLFATLLFGVLLIFSSAYFREKENKEISNAILNKCIQETDSTLSSLDQMITEFLLDNSHINEYMVMKDIERIEEYKMMQSLNRFNHNLNYYYGNEVSLYLFAPRADRIYLNGALYKYSRFGYETWVDQFSSPEVTDTWIQKMTFRRTADMNPSRQLMDL